MESTKIVLTSDAPCRQSIETLVAALGTDPVRGLTAADAAQRLASEGSNELGQEPPTPLWKTFLTQFSNALVILLLAAIAISTALWLYEGKTFLPYEALAILAVVLANAALGCVQQVRAESAVAALQKMSALRSTVIRDGVTKIVDPKELVPGDLLVLEEGETIPADARVIESISLRTAEASLTGESSPVSKNVDTMTNDAGIADRKNMVFSGTAVVGGRGSAIATATGMRTEMGRIAGLLQKTPVEPTPLEKELDKLGKVIGAIVVVIAVVMIATIVATEHVHGFSDLFDVFVLGVALAVAAVPEGLPAMVTMVLALGVTRMAARKAVVRHLSAVETFGSATVIATDKTGTLTKNEMTVRTLVTATGRVEFKGAGYEPAVGAFSISGEGKPTGTVSDEALWALTIADRANNASLVEKDGRWIAQGDPTEAALLVAARKAGVDGPRLDLRFHRKGELPFDSGRKLMTTIQADTQDGHRLLAFTKGAPDVVVARCTRELVGDQRRPLDEDRKRQILAAGDELAGKALRVLGLAFLESPLDAIDHTEADLEHDLVFAGMIGMIDPPRDEAKQAVALTKAAGIRPIMITGDHPATARMIASELGIGENGRVATGAELSTKTDQEFDRTVKDVSIFARVDPSQKLRIVKALQGLGETVAMTGDGVNDAPALKAADIGVAMGVSGTDVSRQAADVVLADDNYATIVSAVEEGRAIFDNIRKFLRYLLSSNIGEVLTMFFGVVFAKTIGLHFEDKVVVLPLLATQILWVNLATDGAPALALGVDPAEPGNMQHPPRRRGESVVTTQMWSGIVIVGIVIAAGTLLVLDASLPGGLIEGTGTPRHAQTMAFNTLVLFQLFNCFNARSDQHSAFHGFFRNGWLWGAIGLSLLLQAAVIYAPLLQTAFSTSPLSGMDWLFCTAVASSVIWIRELTKIVERVLEAFRRK